MRPFLCYEGCRNSGSGCAARAGWQCFRCGELVDSFYEIDHHVPLHLGGSNEPENLVLLCLGCHRDKTQEEMLAFSRGGAIARRRAGAAYGWCCVLCEERLDASFRLIGEEPVCSGCAGVVLRRAPDKVGAAVHGLWGRFILPGLCIIATSPLALKITLSL